VTITARSRDVVGRASQTFLNNFCDCRERVACRCCVGGASTENCDLRHEWNDPGQVYVLSDVRCRGARQKRS